jgi:hypothetical protein
LELAARCQSRVASPTGDAPLGAPRRSQGGAAQRITVSIMPSPNSGKEEEEEEEFCNHYKNDLKRHAHTPSRLSGLSGVAGAEEEEEEERV